MTQIKGIPEWKDSYWKCCLSVQFCPCCTFCVVYPALAKNYGITDPAMILKASTFPVLSYYQIMDTVLVAEKLHMVNFAVESDQITQVGMK